jgi:hypothetical protein
VGAAILGAAWLAMPGRQTLASRELERRRTLFQDKTETAIKSCDRRQIEALAALQQRLGLLDSEVALQREQSEALIRLLELDAAQETGGFPVITGVESVIGTTDCYFVAETCLDKRGADETGNLYLTKGALLFVGASRIEVPWPKIASVSIEQRDLVVQRRDRQTPYRFRMPVLADTLCASRVSRTGFITS